MSEDNLFITPVSGDFDLDRVRAWLDARADVFEVQPNAYRFANTPIDADRLYVDSLAGKSSNGTYATLRPDLMTVDNGGDIDSRHAASELVQWLATTQPVRLRSGEGDIELEDAYPEDVRAFDPPWRHQLREVGFFRYLSHGQDTSVSIEEAQRDTAVAEEAKLVAYLGAGQLYRGGDDFARDEAGDPTGPADVYTDGVYVWPADLAGHVRREHVRLPRHFMIHARGNGWRVPPVDLAALPSSPNQPAPTAEERAWYARPIEADAITLAHGLVTLGPQLRAGAADAVHRGFTRRGSPVLVTLTMRHEDDYAELARELELAVAGVAPLVFVGEAPAATGFADALVEREPAGRSILDRAPMPEAAVIRCGIEAARVLAAAHAADVWFGGLAPEVIYADDDGRFTGLVPRTRRFVASVELQSGGLRSYKLPYSGYEALVLGRPSHEESDVFALCASLFHAATGKHPFGQHLPEVFQRVTMRAPLPFTGSAALGAVLARGLVAEPADRPTAAALAEELAKLA